MKTVYAVPELGREERGHQRAQVYGDRELCGVVQQLVGLFGQPELVAAERENARFYSARADGYEKQPEQRDESVEGGLEKKNEKIKRF